MESLDTLNFLKEKMTTFDKDFTQIRNDKLKPLSYCTLYDLHKSSVAILETEAQCASLSVHLVMTGYIRLQSQL